MACDVMDLECEEDAVGFTSCYTEGDVGEMTIQWLIRGFVIKLCQMMDRSMMTRSLCFPGREILGDISHQRGGRSATWLTSKVIQQFLAIGERADKKQSIMLIQI